MTCRDDPYLYRGRKVNVISLKRHHEAYVNDLCEYVCGGAAIM